MRRLRWWLFLLRYRVARWRGKVWATGMLRPEFIFAYRNRSPFAAELDWLHGVGEDFAYCDHDKPTPRFWVKAGDDNGI